MFTISIAGLAIGIDNRDPYLVHFCRDYRTDEPPLFVVRATDEAIAEEARASEIEYPVGYLESIVVYREIARRLAAYDGFVFHGVALAVGERAYLFTARSGVGKTTHTGLWRDAFADCHVLNGDKPILRFIDGVCYAAGTPWQGKERLGRNEMLPIGGVAFVHRAPENRATSVDSAQAVLPFLSQVYLPEDDESVGRIVALADRILSSVTLCDLYVNMEPDAAYVARRVLIGDCNTGRTEQ